MTITRYLVLLSCLMPVLATDLDSSTTRVPFAASNARVGVLTIAIDKNELTSLPAYYELCLPDGVVLANDLPVPIDLGPKLISSTTVVQINTAVAPFLQLHRYSRGEQCFYIRVMRTTHDWLAIPVLGSTLSPNKDGRLEFTIGVSAAVSATNNGGDPGNSADTPMFVDISEYARCCGASIALSMTVVDAVGGGLLPVSASQRPVMAVIDLGTIITLDTVIGTWPTGATVLDLVTIVNQSRGT